MSVEFLLSRVSVVGETAACAECLSYDINKILILEFIRFCSIGFCHMYSEGIQGRNNMSVRRLFFFQGKLFPWRQCV